MSDATRVLLGLGLGILTGVFFGEAVGFLKVGGDAFIALLQIAALPYILVALITSLGRQTPQSVKALARHAGSVLLGLWALGLLVVLAMPLALPAWPSASFFSPSQLQDTRPVDFLQLYIPSNIFSALANATVPAIVVFSILFGLALRNVANKEMILTPLSAMGDTLMTITGYVGTLAPYGVFALTASAAACDPLPMGLWDRKPARSAGRLANYLGLHPAHFVTLALKEVAPRTYRKFRDAKEPADSLLPLAA